MSWEELRDLCGANASIKTPMTAPASTTKIGANIA
jgi:hypothetical protein